MESKIGKASPEHKVSQSQGEEVEQQSSQEESFECGHAERVPGREAFPKREESVAIEAAAL
jgi:hypothetical protein